MVTTILIRLRYHPIKAIPLVPATIAMILVVAMPKITVSKVAPANILKADNILPYEILFCALFVFILLQVGKQSCISDQETFHSIYYRELFYGNASKVFLLNSNLMNMIVKT